MAALLVVDQARPDAARIEVGDGLLEEIVGGSLEYQVVDRDVDRGACLGEEAAEQGGD
jgi:hypothetical protein